MSIKLCINTRNVFIWLHKNLIYYSNVTIYKGIKPKSLISKSYTCTNN